MQIPGITTSNAGIVLPPRTVVTFHTFLDSTHQVQNFWTAVSDTGSPVLIWKEFHGQAFPEVVVRQAKEE